MQAIRVLQTASEALDEPCGWRTVDDVVIDAHRQIQKFSNRNPPFVNSRLLRDSTHTDVESEVGHGNGPSPSPAEDPNRRHHNRAGSVSEAPREPHDHPVEGPPNRGRQVQEPAHEPELLARVGPALNRLKLIMDPPEILVFSLRQGPGVSILSTSGRVYGRWDRRRP